MYLSYHKLISNFIAIVFLFNLYFWSKSQPYLRVLSAYRPFQELYLFMLYVLHYLQWKWVSSDSTGEAWGEERGGYILITIFDLSWSPFQWLQWLLILSDARNCFAATTAPSAHRQACCTCSSPPGPVCELSSKNYERLTSWTCIAHLLVLHHPYTWHIIYWLQVDSTDDDQKQRDLGVPPTKKTPPSNRSQAAVKQQVLHSSFQQWWYSWYK